MAYINRVQLDSGTSGHKQKTTMHELGHCWSLDHNDAPNAMQTGKIEGYTTGSDDRRPVKNRY